MQAIRGYDRNTGQEIAVQRNILGMSELGGSINLSVDGENLILTSWFDGDVRVWNPETQTRVAHYPNLGQPIAAVRYSGGVAVAEHHSGTVTLHGADEPLVLASGLPEPTGLYASGADLYVGDRTLGQIRLIAQNGEKLDVPEIVVEGLEAPEGFIVTESGFIVVEAEAARLIYIDIAGGRRTLGEFPPGSIGPPGFPSSQIFNGVGMDRDGNLFVTDETSRVLYRVQAPW